MKTIKVKFLDFWPSFNVNDNFIINRLKKYANVVLVDENPDYLFYTSMCPDLSKYQCVRIFYNVENYSPDFNICDYAIGFDEITFNDRYIRYPLYLITDYQYYPGDDYARDFRNMEGKTSFTKEELELKENFCGMVVSRGGCPERDNFFDELCKYKKVLSGGGWKNNIGGQRVADKFKFLNSCKFSIAFENSSTPGYCTEKLMQAFAAKTIPIYFGDPHVGQQFNSQAFVNVHDFGSWEDVIKRIIEIDNNDELYLAMMQTSALKDGYKKMKEDELDAFFANIVNQDVDSAIRRHGQVVEFYELRYKFFMKTWNFRIKVSKFLKIFRNISILKKK